MRVHLILRCFLAGFLKRQPSNRPTTLLLGLWAYHQSLGGNLRARLLFYVFFCVTRNACLCYIYTLHVYRDGRIATRSCIWCLDSVVLKACRWLESDHLSMQHETRGRYNCSPWTRHNGGIKKTRQNNMDFVPATKPLHFIQRTARCF